VQFGWIEPGAPILGAGPWPLYRVARFREKPRLAIAARLTQRGGLWNSFVTVAQPSTLGGLIRAAVPSLVEAFAPARARFGTPWEDEAVRGVYGRLPSTDLSKHVLQRHPANLAVLPVSGLGWNDLGDPARVLATRERAQSELAPA
jgi:mannose-1-phosphate guanylyltransferase